MTKFRRLADLSAWSALILATAVVIIAVTGVEQFRLSQHGLGLLAAKDMPHSDAWCFAGHWLIGLLALLPAVMVLLDGEKPAMQPLRLAGHFWIIAALAYCAQGLWPLNLEDLDAQGNHWHSIANAVWWIAATAGAVAWWRARRTRASAVFAVVMIVLAITRTLEWLPEGQRAITGWLQLFGWLAMLLQERQGVLE